MDVPVTTITVPEPWGIGGVNAYLVEAAEPAIIDPGPAMDATQEALRDGIRDAGYAPTDIAHILVTHPHSDHFGGAETLRRDTDATVHAHRRMADIVEDFDAHKQRQREFFPSYLARMGMPEEMAERIVAAYLPNRTDDSLAVDDRLEGGDTIGLGDVTMKAFDAPGHAHGNMCFLAPEAAFTGDHILHDITPNPTLRVPLEGERPPDSLGEYLDSLRRFPDGSRRGYGGHGPVIPDVPSRRDEIIAHHQDRLDRMLDVLDGPVTPFELTERFFPDIPDRETFLGISEVIAHLRVLEERGDVVRREGAMCRFEPDTATV